MKIIEFLVQKPMGYFTMKHGFFVLWRVYFIEKKKKRFPEQRKF